jgi:prepilin-type N-terminal cleavage/methylation domain-containing protein
MILKLQNTINRLQGKNINDGYSLVELIVSMALFLIVVMVSSSATVSVLRSNREIRQQQQVSQAMDLVLEDVARNARVGYDYNWNSGAFSFKTDIITPGEAYSLRADNNQLKLTRDLGGSSPEIPLSPSNIIITNFDVAVSGDDRYDSGSDIEQPHALISITAKGDFPDAREVTYQTLVTQRRYDNY